MEFERRLHLDRKAAMRALGYRDGGPKRGLDGLLADIQARLAESAEPRWTYKRFFLSPHFLLEGTAVRLQGADIAAHLAGCTACYVWALTMGAQLEGRLRMAEAADMHRAVVLDACASVLTEQYAGEAQAWLKKQAEVTGEFATGRFSPGYGDLPLALQKDILRLLDAQKQIGLTVNDSGIMLPRKSITAIMGIAGHPVTGKLAGCKNCTLFEKCGIQKEGGHCGKQTV